MNELEPTIRHAIDQYAGGNQSPVIYDRARLLAAQALETYDPKKGASEKTHVMNQLRKLQREAPAVSDPMPMPERFRFDQAKIRRVMEEIEQEDGREALPEEIQLRTGLTKKRLKRVMDRMAARISQSEYEQTDAEEDDAIDLQVSERTPWDEWVDAAYNDLSERDKLIFRYRTGYDDAPVLDTNEIARRLNISPQVVSQRSRAIQNKLDKFA